MHQLLQLGSTVQSASGHPCTIETFLGGGGQGEVYRIQLSGKPMGNGLFLRSSCEDNCHVY